MEGVIVVGALGVAIPAPLIIPNTLLAGVVPEKPLPYIVTVNVDVAEVTHVVREVVPSPAQEAELLTL